MPFPEVKRVIYKKNPLDKVICQLRFPPILRIDSELPAEFQDKIRDNFPNYSEAKELPLSLPQEMRAIMPPEVFSSLSNVGSTKNYTFTSEDETWIINLTRTFVALTATNYQRWEAFKDKLSILLDALSATYSPKFFTRVGLRYIDVINPHTLGLDEVVWSDLIKPYILGIAGENAISPHIRGFEYKTEIDLSDNKSAVRLIVKSVYDDQLKNECILIDSDFFNLSKIELVDVTSQLDFLNLRSSRLIQWCIKDKLHTLMEPEMP